MLLTRVKHLADLLQQKKLTLATAESCTGGLLAAYLTDFAGASQWFEGSIIPYSNALKKTLLGVTEKTLTHEGAVSEACVLEMVQGLLKATSATLGIAISGIAGPEGGTPEKPVGLVWFAFSLKGKSTHAVSEYFTGDRQAIRLAACTFAIQHLTQMVE